MTRDGAGVLVDTLRHSRCRNRCTPTMSAVFHGRDASSGPVNIS